MLACSRHAVGSTGRQYCSLKVSRLLYCLVREIKTWLDINHITVHNNTFYILKLKEQLLKIQKLHNKLVVYVIYTHTHSHALLLHLNRFIWTDLTAEFDLGTVFDLGTWNCLPDLAPKWKKSLLVLPSLKHNFGGVVANKQCMMNPCV